MKESLKMQKARQVKRLTLEEVVTCIEAARAALRVWEPRGRCEIAINNLVLAAKGDGLPHEAARLLDEVLSELQTKGRWVRQKDILIQLSHVARIARLHEKRTEHIC